MEQEGLRRADENAVDTTVLIGVTGKCRVPSALQTDDYALVRDEGFLGDSDHLRHLGPQAHLVEEAQMVTPELAEHPSERLGFFGSELAPSRRRDCHSAASPLSLQRAFQLRR